MAQELPVAHLIRFWPLRRPSPFQRTLQVRYKAEVARPVVPSTGHAFRTSGRSSEPRATPPEAVARRDFCRFGPRGERGRRKTPSLPGRFRRDARLHRNVIPPRLSFHRGTRLIATGVSPRTPKGAPKGVPKDPGMAVPANPRRTIFLISTVVLATLVLLFFVGARWRRSRGAGTPSVHQTMLAILPFEDLSGDPNEDYFSDGLTENYH